MQEACSWLEAALTSISKGLLRSLLGPGLVRGGEMGGACAWRSTALGQAASVYCPALQRGVPAPAPSCFADATAPPLTPWVQHWLDWTPQQVGACTWSQESMPLTFRLVVSVPAGPAQAEEPRYS